MIHMVQKDTQEKQKQQETMIHGVRTGNLTVNDVITNPQYAPLFDSVKEDIYAANTAYVQDMSDIIRNTLDGHKASIKMIVVTNDSLEERQKDTIEMLKDYTKKKNLRSYQDPQNNMSHYNGEEFILLDEFATHLMDARNWVDLLKEVITNRTTNPSTKTERVLTVTSYMNHREFKQYILDSIPTDGLIKSNFYRIFEKINMLDITFEK